MDKVKLGVIGVGRLGAKHAENIALSIPEADLVAVCDIDQEKVCDIADRLGARYYYTDYRELLSNDEIDGVVIANSTTEHCKTVCDSARYGKHIFCEKPLGINREELLKINQAVVRNSGKIFQVGFVKRFEQSLAYAKSKIDEGAIGKLILIKCTARDPAYQKETYIKLSPTSGGLIFDMCIHDFDLCRWISGSEINSIYAQGGVYGFEELKQFNDIDNCLISVRLENGVMAQIETSRNSTVGYFMQTEIYGTEGCIKYGPVTENNLTFYDKHGIRSECATWYLKMYKDAYLEELVHFVECIRHNTRPAAGLMDGINAVELAFIANESLNTGEVKKVNISDYYKVVKNEKGGYK